MDTKAREIVRRYARWNRISNLNLPIKVVPGKAEPAMVGRGWEYRTTGGTPVRHPSAYAKVGWSNLVYIPSTRRIEVGEGWLSQFGVSPA